MQAIRPLKTPSEKCFISFLTNADMITNYILADGLKECMVSSYEEISAKMDEGTLNRTVASTNMNNTSSRAHTIVGVTFVQKVTFC